MKNYSHNESSLETLIAAEPEATYSYADYLKWTFEERVELIQGKIFKMSPAPKRVHQEIVSGLHRELSVFLKKKKCKVYPAPFDVRFPKNPLDLDSETYTVVQPDICVVCDLSKLDEAGCKGAPDLIVEILSPSTSTKDLKDKYQLYEEHGVQEYWVVYPGENVVEIFDLVDQNYVSRGKYVREDKVRSHVLAGLEIHLHEIFDQV